MTLTPESTDSPWQYATTQEANDAIQNLQKSDFTKLMIIARSFSRNRLKGVVVESDDLLQEAIVKTLDGRRRWSRKVNIIKHLDRVMESDSSHVAEQRAREVAQLPDVHAETVDHQPSPEARLQAREKLDDGLALFAEDKTALELLRLKSDGFFASEIQRELGMGKTQYETTTKRIRRRLAKHRAKEDK